MTNADQWDELDRGTNAAVLKIRRMFHEAQRRIGVPLTDFTNRSPFEQGRDTFVRHREKGEGT